MGEPAVKPYVSYADYIEMEARSPTKHEWLDGVVYELGTRHREGGGPLVHTRLTATVGRILGVQLLGKRCRVSGPDLEIRVLATGLRATPDASVVCGRAEDDPESKGMAITNPTVLVEVLSDSTEAYDRGEKFAHYRRIPSLKEYVLVGQGTPMIEVFRKNEAGLWVLVAEAGAGKSATLESIGCTLHVDEVYADPLAEPS